MDYTNKESFIKRFLNNIKIIWNRLGTIDCPDDNSSEILKDDILKNGKRNVATLEEYTLNNMSSSSTNGGSSVYLNKLKTQERSTPVHTSGEKSPYDLER